MNEPIGMAALWATIHLLRAMVNRGLVSPNEVDEIHGSLIEGLQTGEASFAATVEAKLGPAFVELRQWAQERWIGKGETDPR